MTNEELVAKFQEGGKECLAELWEQNQGLICMYAKRYASPLNPFEDLMQIGFMGLIKAAEGFNNELGYMFTTYASKAIMGAMYRSLCHNYDLSLDRPFNDEADMTLEDTLVDSNAIDPEQAAIDIDLKNIITIAMKQNLNSIQEAVILEKYFKGEEQNLTEVAKKLGVNKTMVFTTYHAALRRLRQHKLVAILRKEYVDDVTNFYAYRTGAMAAMKNGRGSPVERIAEAREQLRAEMHG